MISHAAGRPWRRTIIWFALLAGSLYGAAVVLAWYLAYQDEPFPCDTIMLVMGGDQSRRDQGAVDLAAAGFSRKIIVPAYNRVCSTDMPNWPESVRFPYQKCRPANVNPTALYTNTSYKNVENTHLEVLMARNMMKELGLKSAIFVSSPYHLRRIKIICDRVFEGGVRLGYRPSRDENPHTWTWFFHWDEIRWVLTESVKIIYFLYYYRSDHLSLRPG
ncbi:MAG: hypothetical protein AB1641_28960 [Thermodesulfobacteriota bacterium]